MQRIVLLEPVSGRWVDLQAYHASNYETLRSSFSPISDLLSSLHCGDSLHLYAVCESVIYSVAVTVVH